MFFYVSKALFFVIQPSNLALILVVSGWLWWRMRPAGRTGRNLLLAGCALIALPATLPIGSLLLLPLEQRFGDRMPPVPDGSVAGIIILGGFEEGDVSAKRGGLSMNDAGERLSEAVRLAMHLPAAKVVFTGGVGNLFGGDDAANPVRRYLVDVGIAEARIVTENQSRTTYENAAFLRAMLPPKPGDRWLLVTSAYHMPRSVGTFRKAGFEVIAYPVDFRTLDKADVRPFRGVIHGLELVDLGVREWLGLPGYYLSGRSDALFPAP